MELLKEIYDEEYPLENISDTNSWKIREAARAILFDNDNLIPLLFVSKFNYHKLPGGGIDEGEDKEKALIRECLEEVGSEIEVIGEIGQITEYRARQKMIQTSYCCYGNIISKGEPNFTDKEVSEGFKIIWLPLHEAISTIENNKSEDYTGLFIQKRDLEFLKRAKKIIDAKSDLPKIK